jgi:hypothetical protein
MSSSPLRLAIFQLIVALVGAVLVSQGALFYLRRVRLERPAIGTFNGRDIAVLFVALGTLPLFYLHLPRALLTGLLTMTFVASLSIGFRPVLRATWLWLAIGALIGADLWTGRTMLGTVHGWQLYWLENSVLVILGAISVANLYVQGGMRLRHVAWFSLILAGYDAFFTAVFPVTNALVENFLGYPLDPSVGMRWGFDNASIGLGDLFVYGLFMAASFKAYGRRAARLAFAVIVVCGAVLPAAVPLLINYVDARTDVLVPAQAWFGPAAFLAYVWMRRRYGPERTMREFLASPDVRTPATASTAAPSPAVAPVPLAQPAAAPTSATR